MIDGSYLTIRHNLWLFLSIIKAKQKRKALPRELRLWMDAVCIDQRGELERNAQVSVMGKIYSKATSVFAWLGWPQGWDPEMTFALIKAASWDLHPENTWADTSRWTYRGR
jgi:Heterokaryon incompatibility protein (HET)